MKTRLMAFAASAIAALALCTTSEAADLSIPATSVSLTPSVASPGTIGSTITFTAAASGGSGDYQYKFLLRAPGGTLNTARDYSSTTTWSWNTSGLLVGTYQVVVYARNVGSTKSYETYKALSYGLTTPTSTLSKIASIDVGDLTACAVGVDGKAWCWGSNDYGQLGTGDVAQGAVPRRTAEGYAFSKISVSTGGAYACGITTVGQAYCWGNQEGGRLGDGTMAPSGQFVTAPVPVSGGHTFTDIAAGGDHACAIATGGAAYCWGHNERGQHGTGNQANSAIPVAVAGGLAFKSITTHQMVTCGVTNGGSAYCWGYGDSGNLGGGTKSSSNVPAPVKGGLTFSSLRLGVWTACGVTTAGDGYCWGYNGSGELGIGSKSPSESLVPAKVAGGRAWKSISPGVAVTCGVTTAGGGFCWGGNASGERGDGPFPSADVTSPVPVVGNLIFDSIDADWSTCGVASGVAYCWGPGGQGAIGDGALVNRGVPTRVAGQP